MPQWPNNHGHATVIVFCPWTTKTQLFDALKFWSELTLLSFNYTILGACLTLPATIYGCPVLYTCSTFIQLLSVLISFYLVFSIRVPLTVCKKNSYERFTDKKKTAGNQLVSYKMKPFSVRDGENTRKKRFRNFQKKQNSH
ncbi:UNVERIFIED_CONTAM: hypothetical protein NCL1_31585 [Trichonephila clavipes]